MSTTRLARRTFLRGGAACVGLPLLEAMAPRRAFAQAAVPSRFVTVYMGTCTGGALSVPATVGPLSAPLPLSFAALSPIASHVSIISGLDFPVYNPGAAPTVPGSALQQQHRGTISPALSGVTAKDGVLPFVRGTTADQIAADFLGPGSRFKSLQLRVQAASYNGRTGAAAQGNGMSVRQVGTTLNELLPEQSPLALFNRLFSAAAPPGPAPTSTAPSRRKSVLDLVLADANRLTANVGAEDKAKLDQHFTFIRELEQSLAAPGGADAGTAAPPTTGATLTNPGADPAIDSFDFGGWANETQRGNQMADMIAYALTCDMTRAVSWMLTHDQCWLNSQPLSGSNVLIGNGRSEIHNDSHFASDTIKAKNANWGAALFGRLVETLQRQSEAGGTVLDSTFLSLVFAEGRSAHAKTNLTFVVAGAPSKIRNGHHLAANRAHPATVQIAGLQAIGMTGTTRLGEVTGVTPGLRLP